MDNIVVLLLVKEIITIYEHSEMRTFRQYFKITY